MASKGAVEKLSYIPIYEEDIDIVFKSDLCEVYISEVDTISKDLDRLEKLEKAFEVLKKSLLLSVVEIHEHYYVCAHDNNYFMKKEEADLIKEVLENE